MPEPEAQGWLSHAIEINAARRVKRFADGRAQGAAWMIECRDMWDAMDEDAGVYFVFCDDESAVDRIVAQMTDDNPNNRVLGIYDLARSLEAQGPGLTRSEWLAGKH